MDPTLLLTVGSRDLTKPEGWVIFFDKTYERPHQTYAATLDKRTVRVTTDHQRCTVRIGDLAAGPFHGALEITVYAGCSLIRFDSVLRTADNGKAILYDAGLTTAAPTWQTLAYHKRRRYPAVRAGQRRPARHATRRRLAHSGRSGAGGSLALLSRAAPVLLSAGFRHQHGFAWRGANYRGPRPRLRFRHSPRRSKGTAAGLPWLNAPPNVDHHLAFYGAVTPGSGEAALADVRTFTHGDRFKPLPGYHTYTSHYHIEHTLGLFGSSARRRLRASPVAKRSPAS